MPNATDKLLLATVTAVSGTELTCTPDGSVGSVTTVDCCGAEAADRVVLEWHYTQLLAVAIVGGPHAATPPADYIVESGTANGWHYDLYASKRIHAWGEFSITWSTANNWYLTVSTPKTMANADYIPLAQISSWKVAQCYAGNRTTTQLQVAVTASSGDTGTVFLTLDGTVA